MKTKTKNELGILFVFPTIIVGAMIFFANVLDLIGWFKNPSVMWRAFLIVALFSQFNPRRPLFASILNGLNSTSVIFLFSFYGIIPLVAGHWVIWHWAVAFLSIWILIALYFFWIKTSMEHQEEVPDEKAKKRIEMGVAIFEICIMLVLFLGLMRTFARELSTPPFF
jgi:small-conductance mechanosensitive channel